MTLEQLKELALKLGVEYHHLIGAEKLKKQLEEYCSNHNLNFAQVCRDNGYPVEDVPENMPPTASESQSEAQFDVPEGIDPEEIKRLSTMTFDKLDEHTRKDSEKDSFKHAMKLTRCIITCNNKNKTSYQGEIFTVRNAYIPTVKKFISFGVPTHVPAILLNMIKEKKYQMYRKEKRPDGNVVTRPYLVPEYNIQELPPLTAEEYLAIRRKQLAEGEATPNAINQ